MGGVVGHGWCLCPGCGDAVGAADGEQGGGFDEFVRGGAADVESPVVDLVMVVGAEQDAVGDGGVSAGVPGDHVVGLGPGGGDGASGGEAAAVAGDEGFAHGGCDEALGAAEVDDVAVGAEEGRDDPGVAGEVAHAVDRDGPLVRQPGQSGSGFGARRRTCSFE